jgi:hypothetical protein
MSAMAKSERARSSNRGGCGGGYEQTSDTYEPDKLRRLRQTYDALEPKWRPVFLAGLSKWEQKAVVDRSMETRS